ncbi:uncharacterized protein FIBRA_02850 [Fibroporia radiculosa]|uniref:Uncharacterized protein n=1 Tax=Fibroporia radiculosa TaxID=599839 RepID=J4G311_9APHY|nr:uncharacterized protein FIBRA_02850 [Fibroporia radiculosa]CCM00808.1 predicted protein [Fibroporia radiculosa]
MATGQIDFSLSQLSLHSSGSTSEAEDWDRSMNLQSEPELQSQTPRNSVAFPGGIGGAESEHTAGHGRSVRGNSKRTLSELLKLHAEKGRDVTFSAEEAGRIAEVLGRWINSGSSPYETDDDFFSRSQDDSVLSSRRSPAIDSPGRPRGQSESVVNTAS